MLKKNGFLFFAYFRPLRTSRRSGNFFCFFCFLVYVFCLGSFCQFTLFSCMASSACWLVGACSIGKRGRCLRNLVRRWGGGVLSYTRSHNYYVGYSRTNSEASLTQIYLLSRHFSKTRSNAAVEITEKLKTIQG